jgi:hypothetical protein
LHAAGWLGGGLALAPAVVLGRSAGDPVVRRARRLTGVLRRPASAARVGRAYLRAHPTEASATQLLDRLTTGWPERDAELERLSTAQLRRRLQAAVRADFAAGRTVAVRGWILAASEARLLGLAALVG